MKTRNEFLALWGLLAVWACAGPLVAQEPPEPPTPTEEPAAASDSPDEKKETPFALYLEAGFGSSENKDSLNASIANTNADFTETFIDLTDMAYGRAAVGWRFAERKGDVRVLFRGYKETDYSLESTGFTRDLVSGSSQASFDVPWWRITIEDGQLDAKRFPAAWSLGPDDANGNQVPDIGEVRCGIPGFGCNPVGAPPSDQSVSRQVADTLQNQIQTIDMLYGREFGTRRYSSHWWAGLRYFEYTGQLVGGAWLAHSGVGVGDGFSNGALLPMIRMTQESSGFGPGGAWEVDFNFFDKGLVLYVRGEAAFLAASVETDSGDFFTVAPGGYEVAARIHESRDKSQWQTGYELGARVMLKNGLQFEAAFSRVGFLDAIIFPHFNFGVSETQFQTFAGAGLGTQDIVLDSIHLGVGFQF